MKQPNVIEITEDEAKEILKTLLSPNVLQDEMMHLQAVIGIIGVVRTMQLLGYRISRPLKAV